jgi:hypothetical protein
MKGILVVLAMMALVVLALAAPALAGNTGEQKGKGGQGPSEISGGYGSEKPGAALVYHCGAEWSGFTRGVNVFNKNH